jgi:hypothetical protein
MSSKGSKGTGEIGITASTNGRRLTLDPLRKKKLAVEVREVESTIPCGFQTPWADGELPDGTKFSLTSGAGVGSRWMTFRYKGRNFAIQADSIIQPLLSWADATQEPVK